MISERKRILLVEDEAGVASFVKKGLTESGYDVSVAFDGNTGSQMAITGKYDLIILDIMLPDTNGLEVCRTIRKSDKQVAILFLTALGTADNVVIGLESEADDYLIKPFKFIELVARVRTLLRRRELAGSSVQQVQEEVFQVADLVLNDYTKTVKRGDRLISFTSTEYRLLLLFMKNPRRVLSRLYILEQAWDVNFNMGTNVVDVYVNYLRKKIDRDQQMKLLHTVIGMGYVLKEPDENSN